MNNKDSIKEFRSVWGKCKYIQGNKYGRLTVIKPYCMNKFGMMEWYCKCDCGKDKIVAVSKLTTGQVKSCGCLRDEKIIEIGKKINRIHGLKKSNLYDIWRGMKKRCYLKTCKAYKYYGGRGIKICDRWLESIENFYIDMGEKPGRHYSLDRINNDGDYCKENCRWATAKEQSSNRRSNTKLTYKGQTKTLSQWSTELGINRSTISYRVKKGLPIEL